MPTIHIAFSAGELFTAALDAARELSSRILKLTDLNVSPLVPGETVDARRHQIAKLGKVLAETFIAIDKLVEAHEHALKQEHGESDVTAGAPASPDAPVDPNTN